MSSINLPAKYYLQHGQEVFTYLQMHCHTLLDPEAAAYVDTFNHLDADEQCLLIRLWSRKPRFLKRASLAYPEINEPAQCLQKLIEVGFANRINFLHADPSLLNDLTKPELIAVLTDVGAPAPKSSSKAALIGMCETWRQSQQGEGINPSVLDHYIERSQQTVIDYLLFLFFGDIGNRFQRFAMRDLGVLRTKAKGRQTTIGDKQQPNTQLSDTPNQSARFENIKEAKTEFLCHSYLRVIQHGPSKTEEITDFLEDHASYSSAVYDKLALKLGEEKLNDCPDQAIKIWQLSDSVEALQKRLRLQYRVGDKDTVKQELESLQNQNLSAAAEVFVSDFYARQFCGERTSVYTQMLKTGATAIGVDEVYLKTAEQGVIDYYLRQGHHAELVENKPWRALFALLFWALLFEQENSQANEFDRLPLVLQRGTFYEKYADEIETQLNILQDPKSAGKYLAQKLVKHYGYPTGLFRWSQTLLETLLVIVQHAPKDAIAAVMRRMAKHYTHANNGYPDILVVQDNKLRFEEIKAPGDVIRPNQLVSINRLQNAGFEVIIRPVEWKTDPDQEYAVVDIETTGGRQSGNSITEIAVVKVRNKEIISEWSSLIKPNRLIPSYITQLTGISNAMVDDAPVFAEVADRLKQELDGCVFVAHNVGFDYWFIKAAYDSLNRTFSMPKLCTVRSARKAFPGLKSYSLGKLVTHFDIDLDNHHRALEDARATAHLLRLIQDQSAQ